MHTVGSNMLDVGVFFHAVGPSQINVRLKHLLQSVSVYMHVGVCVASHVLYVFGKLKCSKS